MDVFNWGIIGGGGISAQFAAGIEAIEGARVWAVASASGRRNDRIRAERYYGSYEELIRDPAVDAVYIGNIHPSHYESAKMCLEGGKPVLCEKPVTMNGRQCRELVELSCQKNLFFMEAMWTRFIPLNRELAEICRNQKFGKVYTIDLSFGNDVPEVVERIYKASLGGGALLDVGVYCVSYANMLLGEHPVKISSQAELNQEKVDLTTTAVMEYPGGTLVQMGCAINRKMKNTAVITTERAQFVVPFFWRPDKIYRYAEPSGYQLVLEETMDTEFIGNGYCHEALEVMRCIRKGEIESPWMSHEDSIRVMETMDEIRKENGIYQGMGI